MARATILTVKEIPAAAKRAVASGKDVWLTEKGQRGVGRLVCRCTAAGSAILMYRYTEPDGARRVISIGAYAADGVGGYTLEQARVERDKLAKRLQAGTGMLREELRDEEAAKAAAKAEAERKAKRGSLSALIDAYVKHLGERQSAYDAGNLLRLHVKEAFPELAALPAAQLTPQDFRQVLARLTDAGKGRTAAKARAYLRAAYSLAMHAEFDPTIPEELGAFDIEANPMDRLPSLSAFSKALDRALTLPELVKFWDRAQALPSGPAKDALLTCILLGGQRPTQMLRVTARGVDLHGETVTLLDIKGRNRHANPRRHVLPIPPDLLPVLQRRVEACEIPDSPLFGATHKETLGALVTGICAAMREAKELDEKKGPFQLRDLRRTAETHMAALGVSMDVRAQIQSHGLGGIQARHYDRHDYMQEKRAALALWAARLNAEPGTVVPLTRGKKAAA